jgi:hypothetical protein
MMEFIPWEIWGSEFLHDIFVTVKNVRIQGILGGDGGNGKCKNFFPQVVRMQTRILCTGCEGLLDIK